MSLALLPRSVVKKWRRAAAGPRHAKTKRSLPRTRIYLETLEDRTPMTSSPLGTFGADATVGSSSSPAALTRVNHSPVAGLSIAEYGGDAHFAGSVSGAFTPTVNRGTSSITLIGPGKA